MPQREALETKDYRGPLRAAVQARVVWLRSIFIWGKPKTDQARSDRLILKTTRDSLVGLETTLAHEVVA